MVQFSISQETLRVDFGVKNGPNFAPNMSKEALWTGLTVGIWIIVFCGTVGRWELGYFSVM